MCNERGLVLPYSQPGKKDTPIWKNAALHLVVGVVVTLIIVIISWQYIDNRSEQNAMFREIEYNTSLLDDIWTKQYESRLLRKYPGGYVLFGVDPLDINQNRSENRIIPRRGRVLEGYAIDWEQVALRKLTDDFVEIQSPEVLYTPRNTRASCTFMQNRKMRPFRQHRVPDTNDEAFIGLVYDKPSLLVFVIGFKPK